MDNYEVPDSLYAQYIKAREEFETIETAYGFATYKVEKDVCYLRDLYVVPGHRRSRVATRLTDFVKFKAKNLGCTSLVTTVAPRGLGSTESLRAILSYGFKLTGSQQDLIYFKLDI